MFAEQQRRYREYAANHPIRFTLSSSLLLVVYFTVQFRNVFWGIGGGAVEAVMAWCWWRPGGPGQRRWGTPRT